MISKYRENLNLRGGMKQCLLLKITLGGHVIDVYGILGCKE